MIENIDLTINESGEMVQALMHWLRSLKSTNDDKANRQINIVKSLLLKLAPTWGNGCNYTMAKLDYEVLLNFKPTHNLLCIEVEE